MCQPPGPPPARDEVHERADQRNQVQGQVHEATKHVSRSQRERLFGHAAEAVDGVAGAGACAAGLDGAAVRDQAREGLAYERLGLLVLGSRETVEWLTASKVSYRASSTKKRREIRPLIVELSLRTTKMADTTAMGPLTKARTAACGTYVKTNMNAVTATVVPMVGTDFSVRGFQSSLWVRKYQIPWGVRERSELAKHTP
jgi:hypothetical protein